MKRLVICLDGTWNQIDSGDATNVVKMAQAVALSDGDTKQVLYYDEGIGTEDGEGVLDEVSNYWDGAFGHGLMKNLTDAYSFLVLNYEVGDEIFVFGFSRGAFTARSLCGLIRNAGIVDRRHLVNIREAINLYVSRKATESPDSDYCRRFRNERQTGICLSQDLDWLWQNYPEQDHDSKMILKVNFLGVWDTVGALGLPVPDELKHVFNKKYGFHDTNLSTFVHSARHAVSADEKRNTFSPTLWANIDHLRSEYGDRYDEKIFPGTHSGVGGGGPVVGLSDISFEWIFRGAEAAGLVFDKTDGAVIYRLQPNHLASLHNVRGKTNWSAKDWLMGVGTSTREFARLTADDLHESIIHRYHDDRLRRLPDGEYRPDSLSIVFNEIEDRKLEVKGVIDDRFNDLFDDSGLLVAPARIISHTIVVGEDLSTISEFYYRQASFADLIFAHNYQLGRLHNKSQLYVGREIQIPFYDLF